jgi:hypothetical protein
MATRTAADVEHLTAREEMQFIDKTIDFVYGVGSVDLLIIDRRMSVKKISQRCFFAIPAPFMSSFLPAFNFTLASSAA